MVAIIDDGGNIERQHPASIRYVPDIDIENHAVILAYACIDVT
jgi:hypothetical protein